jgi:hypothetical protein
MPMTCAPRRFAKDLPEMSRHEIVDNATHRDLRVLADHSAELGDGVMACLIVPDEFRMAQAEFPIVFRRDLETGKFSAWALFGFEEGENLFLSGDQWDARYKPLALAIQPFLIGRGGSETSQVHIDMDHPRVSETQSRGVRLFDDLGVASPYLEAIAEKLGMLDSGHRGSADFHAALERFDLLEPFTLEVPLADGTVHSLVGFHTLHEERLAALPPAALAELHAADYLMPLYMALASLSQFGELAGRKNRMVSSG